MNINTLIWTDLNAVEVDARLLQDLPTTSVTDGSSLHLLQLKLQLIQVVHLILFLYKVTNILIG